MSVINKKYLKPGKNGPKSHYGSTLNTIHTKVRTTQWFSDHNNCNSRDWIIVVRTSQYDTPVHADNSSAMVYNDVESFNAGDQL